MQGIIDEEVDKMLAEGVMERQKVHGVRRLSWPRRRMASTGSASIFGRLMR
jgi:hypothetical protein